MCTATHIVNAYSQLSREQIICISVVALQVRRRTRYFSYPVNVEHLYKPYARQTELLDSNTPGSPLL